jgi:hypothetical protein
MTADCKAKAEIHSYIRFMKFHAPQRLAQDDIARLKSLIFQPRRSPGRLKVDQ